MGVVTKASVDLLIPPVCGQKFLRDDRITGLAVRVTAAGVKSFVFEGRVRGRVKRVTIGPYPYMTVALARQEALRIKTEIAQGRDPIRDRAAQRKVLTFGDLEEVYIERYAKPHKRTWKRDAQMIAGYLSRWRNRMLSDITIDDVARLHERLGRENGRYAANRTVALLRTMFNLARDWGHLETSNPAARVKFYREEKRDRFLSPEELRRVNEALAEEPDPYWRAYFPLSLLLGTRKSELQCARWEDMDLDQKTWRIPSTKAGRPHLLPLPNAAAEILKGLPKVSEFVFPGKGASGHLAESAKAWQRIRKRAGVPDARMHDLRRTLGSWLAAQGHSLPLIGRALNHSNVSTTQVYARLDLGLVREALERNAALMLGSDATPKAEVPTA
jgi:integrase